MKYVLIMFTLAGGVWAIQVAQAREVARLQEVEYLRQIAENTRVLVPKPARCDEARCDEGYYVQ